MDCFLIVEVAHYQSWSLSDDPQRYSPSWRSQDTKVSKSPLDQFLNTPLLANLRHRQGEEARRQHKKTFPRRFVSPAVDHARIGKIIPAAYVSHLQNSTGKFIKCLLLKAGWQKLRERGSGAPRKVRVFYERKDLQHTLFCRET